MSIATMEPAALEAFDGFVGQDRSIARANPHALRYGYMPGVYFAKADARTTGHIFFQQGALIKFATFPSGGHFNAAVIEDAKAPSSKILEITAAEALANAGLEYPIWESIDQGFVGLPELTGNEFAQTYFDLLHPPFAAFDYACPFGLLVCPTCRGQWLESEKSKAYFNENCRFDADSNITLAVKQALYDSTQRYVKYCDGEWKALADQYERTRNAGTPFVMEQSHHHTRKCIHQDTMEDKELNRLRMLTNSNAAAIGEAVRGVGSSAPAGMTDEELADFYAWRAAKAKGATGSMLVLKDTELVVGSGETEGFQAEDKVLCDNEPGTIKELKTGGWFLVELTTGETKTVRKDKLQLIKEKTDEQSVQSEAT